MSSDLLRESEAVELKKSLAELKEGLVSIAAILNKNGAGELWFGVAPSGKAVGLDVTEKTLRDLSQAIAAHIEPKIYPQVSTQTVAGKTCIHIRFDGQNAPYFAHGRAYMRVAGVARQLSAAELEQIIVDKNQTALRWDNRALDKPWPALDTQKVKRFVQRAHLQWDTLGDDDETRLQRALEKLELIEEAQKYILKNIHIGMRLEGLYRVDVPEISMDALREAIVNALCHRDWRDPDYVHVAVFKDRVEIRNPGTLYGGLTIADLHRGNVSKRRNPLIADLFRRIEMVESWGRGMTLIHQNAPTVTFRQVAGLFIASFARPSFSLNDEETTGTTENTKEPTQKPLGNNVKTTQKPHASPREKLMALLKAQPAINTKDLAQLSGATLYSVRHHLESLKAEGRIRHVGPSKGGRWEVLDLPEQGGAE